MTTLMKKKRTKKTPHAQATMTKQEKQELKKAVDAAYGCLSWVDYSVDEYLREKWAETEQENNS